MIKGTRRRDERNACDAGRTEARASGRRKFHRLGVAVLVGASALLGCGEHFTEGIGGSTGATTTSGTGGAGGSTTTGGSGGVAGMAGAGGVAGHGGTAGSGGVAGSGGGPLCSGITFGPVPDVTIPRKQTENDFELVNGYKVFYTVTLSNPDGTTIEVRCAATDEHRTTANVLAPPAPPTELNFPEDNATLVVAIEQMSGFQATYDFVTQPYP